MLQNRLKIGEFDVRLVIDNDTGSQNSVTNEVEENWVNVSTVSAKRMVKGGRYGFEADQQTVTNKETFLIRYSSDVSGIDTKHRVYEKGTTDYYYVTLVEKQKRERWIMIEAEKKNG